MQSLLRDRYNRNVEIKERVLQYAFIHHEKASRNVSNLAPRKAGIEAW